ncbi:hypothetical protein [Nocardioides sp.]|uniref:maltokinase N-terminal cap-like domain-containing protein n=1 Tax=Nocardioides sp. TaxID=35761 RepID=UPI00356664B4
MTHARDHLRPFIEQARWFGGKGRDFTITGVRRLGQPPHEHPSGPGVAIDLVTLEFVEADGTTEQDTYQVPLAFYAEAQSHLAHALVGEWDDPDFGPSHVYDAVHDRRAMAAWQRGFSGAAGPAGALQFHRMPGHELDLAAHSTLFSGEQSNSSVAFGEDALMKVFRRITPGVNPDIEVHEVLTRSGSPHVAALYGWLEAPAEDGEVLHLAMLQQFLRTASDGWDLALASVRNLFGEADLRADEVGGDFAAEARRLGVALAETHASLAQEFPTEHRTGPAVADLAATMHRRLDQALPAAPRLEEHAERLRRAFDAVADLDDLVVQRIHGDLHLGQTLRTVRGWKIVDFEGEPAKPLAERLLPDSRWRDVAGMLRSFDYAPRVVERTWDDNDDGSASQRAYRADEWSARNRDAFLHAYAGRDLTEQEQQLLAAYVADKAVYETVYETRNRPTWVEIPLQAVARIGA